jgi:N-acylneuraminate cytidylyltransferase
MIAYTIAAARASALFDSIVVSTDDSEIAAIARELGAEVPFLREPALADDMTPVSTVTLDTLERLAREGRAFSCVAQLMPNCPLRNDSDIRDSFAAFRRQPHRAQVSVTRYGWQNPWWALEVGPDGAVEPLFQDLLFKRSQDLPDLFCPTGAVWWIESEALRESGTFHLPKRAAYELPWDRAVDVDDLEDFQLAELLLDRARGIGRDFPVDRVRTATPNGSPER